MNKDDMLLKKHLRMSQYSYMEIVYFNNMKPPIDFRLPKDPTTLVVLRSKLDNLFPNTDNRKVVRIEFRAPSINTQGNMKYNTFKLKTDEDLNVLWRTYHHRPTKGSIEFDAMIVRSINDIIKMIKHQESSISV